MADETPGGGAPATTATATTVDTTSPTTTTTAPVASDEAKPSHGDWNAMAQNIREFKKLAQQIIEKKPEAKPEPPKPEAKAGDISAEIAALKASLAETRREAALKETYADLGIKPGPVRELLEMAVKQANPENVREFVEKYAATLAAPAPAATPATAPGPQRPKVTTDTGPPAADPKTSIPDDIRFIPPEVWKGMSSEERRKRFEAFTNRNGGGNQFRARKEALGRKT